MYDDFQKYFNETLLFSKNMSGSESDSDFDSDIEEAAEKEISLLLLPEKSKEKYQRVYDNFKKWCRDKNFSAIDGEVIVEYFSTELRFLKATTSWSIYSQLRLTLMINDNFDISTIKNLRDLLKSRSVGHNAKKSRTFNKEEFYRFIKEAPDDDYLAMKVNFVNTSSSLLCNQPLLGPSYRWRLWRVSSG